MKRPMNLLIVFSMSLHKSILIPWTSPLSWISRGMRLPLQLRHPLLNEMENRILHDLMGKNKEANFSDIFLRCSLLSNFLYGYHLTRVAVGLADSLSCLT